MSKEIHWNIIETIIIVLAVSFGYLRNLDTVEFHKDESHWIGTSYMFEAYFKGEFWSDAWGESHQTVTNPPVPRYLIGISRFIGGYRVTDLNRPWNYQRGVNFNERVGAMPSDNLLWWSRLPMAILAVASIWMAFWFVKKFAGRLAGYLWVISAIFSPFLLLQTRRAMAESSILFFVMLAAVFCYFAVKQLTQEQQVLRWKVWLFFGLSGICAGLAGESKLNGLAMVGAIVLSIVAALWRRADLSGLRKFTQFMKLNAFVIILTIVTFWGIYPYLWPDLWGRTVHVFQNRVKEMSEQTIAHPVDYIASPEQRLTILPARILEDYFPFPFQGARYINFFLTLLGLGIAAASAWTWIKGKENSPAALVFLLAAFAASGPAFLTLLDWDRYYLFPVFFSTMAVTIALGWLAQMMITRIFSPTLTSRLLSRH
jgi:4-amino-4-deoxy-L-arabinose transferase-like glycosyltransferase